MRPVHVFTVNPRLPKRLKHLKDLAYNLYWTWNNDIIDLFRRLDSDLWEETGHNPVLMLGKIPQARLEEAAEDDAFLAHLDRVREMLENYVHALSWHKRACKGDDVFIAYFSSEYGITECMPVYSGGLGVLAGDYLKSASDLGIPLVGVGLLYQQGYFRQYLNSDGWQQESYPENDFYTMPVLAVDDEKGDPLEITVELSEGPVVARVWKAQMGRVPLYLLDTNIDGNSRLDDRDITDKLYGGDREYRIRQEILLGIGGIRLLERLGIRPTVYHMNEGHSAFLVLERIRSLMREIELSFTEAREVVQASCVFTTHTSVPAGLDIFDLELVQKYFAAYSRELGISWAEFLSLAGVSPRDKELGMAVLAFRNSMYSNGVSKIHGRVSRSMWKNLWSGLPKHEVPVTSVTNGVHIRSWISKDMAALFNRYLGPGWIEDPLDRELWDRIFKIPDEELWRTHERRRERLVAFARRCLRSQLEQRGVSRSEITAADEVLDPAALTIGFARRFATYKRADLLLRDPERLARILADPQRPVQVIYAGKAHPKDKKAKEILRKLIHLSRHEPFRSRIVFIENYSILVSRYLVQGVDLWLNTPRRPNEASGTSGMKAAANGAIHMSILDGWWDEAYENDIGYAIGHGETYENLEYQDEVESNAVYKMLEREVVPTFYDRGGDRLPRGWIALMKASMRAICPQFNSNRMIYEYYDNFYRSCTRIFRHLSEKEFSRARNLAAWKANVATAWSDVKITAVTSSIDSLDAGSELPVRAEVSLGGLKPEDVSVQIYFGGIGTGGEIAGGRSMEMKSMESTGKKTWIYEGAIPCSASGRHGFTVRVLPKHEDLGNPFLMNLVTWA